jgi:hypothetical protein
MIANLHSAAMRPHFIASLNQSHHLDSKSQFFRDGIVGQWYRLLKSRLADLTPVQLAVVSAVFVLTFCGAVLAALMFRWWNARNRYYSQQVSSPGSSRGLLANGPALFRAWQSGALVNNRGSRSIGSPILGRQSSGT